MKLSICSIVIRAPFDIRVVLRRGSKTYAEALGEEPFGLFVVADEIIFGAALPAQLVRDEFVVFEAVDFVFAAADLNGHWSILRSPKNRAKKASMSLYGGTTTA